MAADSPPRRLSRAEARARTRDQLLDAAETTFRVKGIGETSLQDIATAAGLTKGAIYSNFESKEDLFLAALARTEANVITTTGATAAKRRTAFRRAIEARTQDVDTVAFDLETTSFALRHDRARQALAARHAEAIEDVAAERWSDDQANASTYLHLVQAVTNGLIARCALDPNLLDTDLIEHTERLLASARQDLLESK